MLGKGVAHGAMAMFTVSDFVDNSKLDTSQYS